MNNLKIIITIAALSVFFYSTVACSSGKTANKDETHDAKAAEIEAGHGGKEEKEKSDLDKSVEELFAQSCEHEIPMYRCDECRYEAGVVKVPKSVFDGELVKTALATKSVSEEGISLTGEIAFDEGKIAGVSPIIAGTITKVIAYLGQPVKVGQALLAVKSAELAAAQADFLEADSKLKLAQKTYERQKSLREANVNAERDLLEAEREQTSSQIKAGSAKQKLVQFGMTDAEIGVLLKDGMKAAVGEAFLRSPLNGKIIELRARVGEVVTPSDKLLVVADTTKVRLIADLYEKDLPEATQLLKESSSKAAVLVDAFSTEEFAGKLTFIGASVDEKTRTVKTVISLENPEGKLRPGMFAKATLASANKKETLVIPTSAVLSDEGDDFVFIHKEGDYYVRRRVVKGSEKNGLVVIKLGLDAGTTVVSEGAFILKSDVLRSKMGAGCAD